MPTYVYKFIDTGETIEVQQSFSDDTLTEYAHPETGAKMAVKKVFLPVGVTFKGDGFYKTDSRAASKSASKSASTSTSSDTNGSSADSSGSSSKSSDSNGSGSSESSGSSSKAAASTSSNSSGD